MNDTASNNDASASNSEAKEVQPLSSIQRRILGVLMEKARTTPDAYPLSLNGLVTGCNQKSNRAPLMNLRSDDVEEALDKMRDLGIVAEVHGGGRVPKYRHYGFDYLGVRGAEAAVLTELLLRGEQSVGDLRSRASRFETIADLNALKDILSALEQKGLVVPLTPEGRGQLYTHNLYKPEELEAIKSQVATGQVAARPSSTPTRSSADPNELEALKSALSELQNQVQSLNERVAELEGK